MTDETPRGASQRTHYIGMAFAVVSALAYTGTNVALRKLSSQDFGWSVWVTCIKAMPAALTAWVFVIYRASTKKSALPPRRLVLPLIAAGLFMQCAGNVAFQWALGAGGLALTVPVLFATLITTGALAGRFVLGEGITVRSAAAMGILIVSIGLLSIDADKATQAVAHDSSVAEVLAAILSACLAGLAYGITGVVIRRLVSGDMSVSATLVLLSSSGFIGLGFVSVGLLGTERMLQTTSEQWMWMLLAGVLNAVAFFAVSGALKRAPVTQVNITNASQAAMCAIAGVLWFNEAETIWIGTGTALTIVGILMMDRGKRV